MRLLALAAVLGVIVIQDGGGSGGGSPTDFTSDPDCLGAWLIFTDGTESSAEADNCTGDATDNLTFAGTTAFDGSATPPAGSASGQDAVALDRVDQQFSLSHATKWEAANFTVGCWLNPDNDSNNFAMSKRDVQNWELVAETDNTFRMEVTNVQSDSATTWSTGGGWYHVVARYDGTGTHADAVDDAIEVFVNGLIDCDGATTSDCDSSTDPTGNTIDVFVGSTEGSGYFGGDIMECFYMDRVLSDEEIADVFLCGLDGSATAATRDSSFGGAQCGVDSSADCCT